MTYNWDLLAFYVRKPCRLCKLPAELQEWLYHAYRSGRTLREILGDLHAAGYKDVRLGNVYKHRRHQRQLIERFSQPSETTAIQLKITQAQLQQLKLARTKEEMASAILRILRSLVSQDKYEQIIRILQEASHE